jgi:1-deoxy-D-xylulose-5-phosphate synthase
VCAIYSTFLQRGFDQLIHDVALGGYPVVLGVDRAGLVGADGPTHQGAFDVGYLLAVPGMAVYAPSSYAEVETALRLALRQGGPAALRYPRGREGAFRADTMAEDVCLLQPGGDVTIVSYGIMINSALAAAEKLAEAGVSAAVLKINRLDGDIMSAVAASCAATRRLIIVEDTMAHGGLGERLSAALAARGAAPEIRRLNLGGDFVPAGEIPELYRRLGIDAQGICAAALDMMGADAPNPCPHG